MSRNPILDDTVAHLMAERFAGPRRPEYGHARPPPIYDDEALENARVLLEAITDDDDSAGGP